MFASIIQYRLNPIFERDFLRIWNDQQVFLKKQELISNSYLHRETKITFIAYTRWLQKEHFESHIVKPTGEMLLYLQRMEECCNSITIKHRLYTLENSLIV